MEVKYKLVPVEPNDEQQLAGAQAIRIETTPINKMFTANRVYRDMISVIPDQPSDLEIVRKALSKIDVALFQEKEEWYVCEISDFGDYHTEVVANGSCSKSLLTWAKQTIGE